MEYKLLMLYNNYYNIKINIFFIEEDIMKILTLTSLALGIVMMLGVNSPAEAIINHQNDGNIVMAHGPYYHRYYYDGPYYYGPRPGYYYNGPLLCVAGFCI